MPDYHLLCDTPTRVLLINACRERIFFLRRLLRQADQDAHYIFTDVASLATGLERLRRETFDIVLIHFCIGEQPATLAFLQNAAGKVPIVASTDAGDDTFRKEALEFGASACLTGQDASPQNIALTVTTILDRNLPHTKGRLVRFVNTSRQ